jgi:hypothetical protein
VAKRLDWEKESKRLKIIREGSQPLWEDLPVFTGSPAEQKRIRKEQWKKRRAKLAAAPMSKLNAIRNSKSKVLRRRKNEGTIEVEKRKRG